MKNLKMYLSAFAILAVVGSALAVKSNKFFGHGTIYCEATCTTLKDFTPDTNGLLTKVCGTESDGITEKKEYQKTGSPLTCNQIALGQNYSATQPGK